MNDRQELLRSIPQLDKVLDAGHYDALIDRHSRSVVVRALREHFDRLRHRAKTGELDRCELDSDRVQREVAEALERAAIPFYQRVINATGVILHTGLGRAPLPPAGVAALAERAGHPVRVEVDLESGERGGRDFGCARRLVELTGAEAACVVNNNAGATLLILAALARGREVIVSNGELVEIGGSYRVPAVMEESGAKLRAVGTTNRTHLRDYEQAIGEETGLILKVHTSNYRIEGFTKEVEIHELVELGRRHGLPVVHDLGSGCLVDLERRGVIGEPHVNRSVGAGADLVCFSGDKLLGGPQSGLIVGTRDAVERCRKHPLYRALRPCRLTYLSLEAVLRLYEPGEEEAIAAIPALGRLLAPPAELARRATTLAQRLQPIAGLEVAVVEAESLAGSGSLPARHLSTSAVSLRAGTMTSESLARELRTGDPSVFGRVRDDAILLDLRTIDDDEFSLIEARLRAIFDPD